MDVNLSRPGAGWLAALACAFLLAPARSSEAGEWPLCAPSAVPPPPAPGLESTTIEADSAAVLRGGNPVAEGNVVLKGPERTVTSRRMEYDPETGRFDAAGEVTVRSREMFLRGSRLEAELDADETVLHDASFSHPASHGRGEAKRIENVPGATLITDGSFTTCDPGSNAWRLEAKTLELDRESRTGTARHARLKIRDVPVLYLPWVSFPLGSERKTGLLTPSFGSSRKLGTTITQPLYLNLAPNYDATVRLRSMSRRGLGLAGRFRYLTEDAEGTVEAEGLPEDRVTHDARSFVSFHHRHRFTPALGARLEYARASDPDYLRDLGVGSRPADLDHLRHLAETTYEIPGWRLETRFEQFQTLKAAPSPYDPYRILPRIALDSRLPERNRSFNYDLHGEITRFEHRSTGIASGVRTDVQPSVSFPVRMASGYLLPRAALRHTRYDLDRFDPGVPETSSRVLPVLSIDSGLFFDRPLTFRDRRFTQTLEPRLHYLRVPYRDQDHLPLFDAGAFTFGYDHLFRENRFSGIDRIGDADRLTLALETRLLDEGRDVLGFRLAHARHFRDRRVRLCTTADPTWESFDCPEEGAAAGAGAPRSAWVAAVETRPHRSLAIGSSIGHDGGSSRERPLTLDLRYRPSSGQSFRAGYRRIPVVTEIIRQVTEKSKKMTESITFSSHRDLGRHVRVFGSVSHALEEDRLTTANAGLEYDSCCWRVRLLGERYLRSGSGTPAYENLIWLQWELKGWTGAEFGLR